MKRDKAKVPFFSPGRKEERDEVARFSYMQRGKKRKKRETKGRRRFARDGNGHTEGLAGSGNGLKINRFFFSIFERPGGSMTEQEN